MAAGTALINVVARSRRTGIAFDAADWLLKRIDMHVGRYPVEAGACFQSHIRQRILQRDSAIRIFLCVFAHTMVTCDPFPGFDLVILHKHICMGPVSES